MKQLHVGDLALLVMDGLELVAKKDSKKLHEDFSKYGVTSQEIYATLAAGVINQSLVDIYVQYLSVLAESMQSEAQRMTSLEIMMRYDSCLLRLLTITNE